MVDQLLHFTIGPVQSFVGQARRTRDLWAGSFLLSWLAGQAMAAVLETPGGRIVFPDVGTMDEPTDPMIKAIVSGQGTPLIGTIPNRFKGIVPKDFDPLILSERIHKKWHQLAKQVYQQFVDDVADKYGCNTREIWTRQVASPWEISWVMGDMGDDPGDAADNFWLDIRKNWRNFWPVPEDGDLCLIMPDYQEISGYIRVQQRQQQETFWQTMQKNVPDDRLDLRDYERLSAIALIKRLFPRLSENTLKTTIGWIPGGNAQTSGNWPSTTYMAVAPWLADIAGDPKKITELKSYLHKVRDTVNRQGKNYYKKLASEQATELTCLAPLRRETVAGKRLDDIDGDLLHYHALKNHRSTFLSDAPTPLNGKDPEPEKRQQLLQHLSTFYQKLQSRPRSYYALLLMDGDKLGALLCRENQQAVSQALLSFTGRVDKCVTRKGHCGITIYAGGDDVLVLLPITGAIACADVLNKLFVASFSGKGIDDATSSIAIIFAHHLVPLQNVLARAHDQLENVAKDGNGRNSLALTVLKPSGITNTWVSCWDNQTASPVAALQKLVDLMNDDFFPRGFFHKLRDRYGFYESPNIAGTPHGIDYRKLLLAEFMQSRKQLPPLAQAEKAIDTLVQACQTTRQDEQGTCARSTALTMAGGFIARFLTQEDD